MGSIITLILKALFGAINAVCGTSFGSKPDAVDPTIVQLAGSNATAETELHQEVQTNASLETAARADADADKRLRDELPSGGDDSKPAPPGSPILSDPELHLRPRDILR